MGRVDSKGFMRGKSGGLVFKVIDGKQYFQQASSEKINQSARTKESSSIFGNASRQAAFLRGKLKPWLAAKVDMRMNARLTGSCYKALKSEFNMKNGYTDFNIADMKELTGFDFNKNSPFANFFNSEIKVKGTPQTGLIIEIPSFTPLQTISYPKNCQYADLHLVVLHTSWSIFGPDFLMEEQWFIEKNTFIEPDKFIAVPVLTTPGITLVFAQLQFFKMKSKFGKEYLNSILLNPCTLVVAY